MPAERASARIQRDAGAAEDVRSRYTTPSVSIGHTFPSIEGQSTDRFDPDEETDHE
jgi:hypothetical protein